MKSRKSALLKRAVLAGAALGGMSDGALAQSVTLYGLIDTEIRYSNNNPNGRTGSSRDLLELGEGYFSGSRWGVRGNEDLGAGWQALFNLESGYDLSTGASLQGTQVADHGQVATGGAGRLFGRQSYVGLGQRSLGTLTFGRQFTTAYDATARFQPYGHPNQNAVAIFNNYTGPRQDNMAKYAGNWSGLSLAGHYTFGEVAGNASASSSRGVAAGFAGSGFDAGAFWQQTQALRSAEKRTVWGAGGNYQAGIMTLALGYMHNAFALAATRNHVVSGGASVRATPALTVSLVSSYDRQLAPGGYRLIVATVAEYALSKRSSVYAELDLNRIGDAYPVPGFMAVKGNKLGGGVGTRHRF